MLEKFTDRARRVTVHATRIAVERGDDTVEPSHLLMAMLTHDRPVTDALQAAGSDTAKLTEFLGSGRPGARDTQPTLSTEAGEILRIAGTVAEELGQSLVVPLHIAIAVVRSGRMSDQLSAAGLDAQLFEDRALERMPSTEEIEAKCNRCGAPTDEFGKVKELTLDVEGKDPIHLYAYYCGQCGSTYGLVKG